ncbi:MAG TPA: hypothetical protein VJK00_06885 [Steroidobacteraceae bacterium]|nr:hypothetical protein [Steroidobacteraceae bacterium]
MNAPVPPSITDLAKELVTALLELAVAVNRQTQAVELLAEHTRQWVELASAASAAPDDGSEDQDHLPTHDLSGQPIHVR